MVATSRSASWLPLNDTFYCNQRVYSLAGSALARVDLSDHVIAAARCGGPIALMRDRSKPVLLGKYDLAAAGAGAKISVYSSAGQLLQTITWDSPSPIVHLAFLSPLSLLLLTSSGLYRLYTISTHTSLPPSYTQHAIPNADDHGGVREAKSWEAGFVALMESGAFVEVKGFGSGRVSGGGVVEGSDGFGGRGKGKGRPDREGGSSGGKATVLASTGLDSLPDCWCVVPPDVSSSRGTEVLLAKAETVWRLDEIDCVDQRLSRGPYLSITPSPSGHFLALLCAPPSSANPPQLWVTSSDFSRSFSDVALTSEMAAGEKGRPRLLEWCGSNSVVVAWERTVVMVGPYGETLKFFYTDPVHLVTEIDGTRILSSEGCDFLQIVPQSSQSVHLPGSTSPASLLYEASLEFYDRKSPRADEYVRNGLLRSENGGREMREAVERCLDAAAREWDQDEQKRLLKAAAFGKSFLEAYNPNHYVQMTKILRVLNAVRDYKVGLPLTWDGYHAKPPSHLVSRLVALSQHLLALRISSFLGLSPSPVIKHWAQQLIAASAPGVARVDDGAPLSDEEVSRLIVDKLQSLSSPTPVAPSTTASTRGMVSSASSTTGPAPDVPLSSGDIALTAFRLGRPHLAALLIEREPRADKQVPLLLRMGESEEAMKKAVISGDPELVFQVLLHLRQKLSPGDLFRLVERVSTSAPSSATTSPYIPHTRDTDSILILQLFLREIGEEKGLLRDFWYQDDRRVEMGCELLVEASRGKELTILLQMVDDHIRLLVMQQQLEQDTAASNKTFVGLSVNETIRQCILAGMDKKAEKVRGEFKVPDKRFWYLKLRSLISLRDWDALDSFARLKKSPIGYEPWVDELIRVGAHRQAVKYVERCDVRNRVELYVKCGEWVMAGQECVRRGESGRLHDLKARSPNNIIAAQLDELLQDMGQGH
ncbi:vacuolar assembling/sorting protein VPS16 [Rhodotorula toruloides]|uniref:Probable vacuolar protein sorting-associated protein 16 homolog n=1 Tax=Rhodotorula toruloides TaxID=5286 RepID=A0A511KBS4_RHOTO|nr:vacuolar assembling/sorting protein VPS16 [Rhodotorula toruloides]